MVRATSFLLSCFGLIPQLVTDVKKKFDHTVCCQRLALSELSFSRLLLSIKISNLHSKT